jgi:K+-transporting ATPase ATPase C chain
MVFVEGLRESSMLAQVRPALVMLALFTLLTGLAYSVAVTGLAQLAFHDKANGSLSERGGVVVGSAPIGQDFFLDKYPRPSAASTPDPTDPAKSICGPTSRKLVERVDASIEAEFDAGRADIIADAVTTSASGLDPHISPQVAAVAKAQIESRWLGRVGEPRINVLLLNLALDALR